MSSQSSHFSLAKQGPHGKVANVPKNDPLLTQECTYTQEGAEDTWLTFQPNDLGSKINTDAGVVCVKSDSPRGPSPTHTLACAHGLHVRLTVRVARDKYRHSM